MKAGLPPAPHPRCFMLLHRLGEIIGLAPAPLPLPLPLRARTA